MVFGAGDKFDIGRVGLEQLPFPGGVDELGKLPAVCFVEPFSFEFEPDDSRDPVVSGDEGVGEKDGDEPEPDGHEPPPDPGRVIGHSPDEIPCRREQRRLLLSHPSWHAGKKRTGDFECNLKQEHHLRIISTSPSFGL